MTVHRTPTLSAIDPITMPPAPNPTQPSEFAREGTVRMPPVSAAIDLSATMMIQGPPNDSARMTSTTLATIHDDLDSTDCTLLSVSFSPRHCDGGSGKAACKTGCVTPPRRNTINE